MKIACKRMRTVTQKREHGLRSITESRIENVSVYKTSMYSVATRIRMTIWTTCAGLPFIRAHVQSRMDRAWIIRRPNCRDARRHLLMHAK